MIFVNLFEGSVTALLAIPEHPVLVAAGHVAPGGGHLLAHVLGLIVHVHTLSSIQVKQLARGQQLVLRHLRSRYVDCRYDIKILDTTSTAMLSRYH